MEKAHIIREIQRTAKENGGVALGSGRFEQETGISTKDWLGKYWARWGDAAREAGVEPNKLQGAHPEDHLLEQLALLSRKLSKVPSAGDIRLEATQNPVFPAYGTFNRRFGSVRDRNAKMAEFSKRTPGYEDVAEIYNQHKPSKLSTVATPEAPTSVGYVYLLKHGSRREYKIGRTNNPLRREGEIGVELPERAQPVHRIETDDPSGIEKYWHDRFKEKRKNGEWFLLTSQDVAAFKRWKRIY